MATFIETPRFPDTFKYGTAIGPMYSTWVTLLNSGYEQRNINWQDGLLVFNLVGPIRQSEEQKALLAFFRNCKGRGKGFRIKDWTDYEVASTEGRLDTGAVGDGTPTYQLYKRYTTGAETEDRAISKPVSGSVTVYRNAVAQTAGAGAGNYALDTTTGIVTFVADASSAASSITVGATTQVVLAANPGSLIAGELLYLSGFAGADAASVNGIAHTISSVSGAGPYTFTLATNTAGRTITLGSGVGYAYPQATDALTWAGEFDVPVRFDVDRLPVTVDAYGVYNFGTIPIVEIRV